MKTALYISLLRKNSTDFNRILLSRSITILYVALEKLPSSPIPLKNANPCPDGAKTFPYTHTYENIAQKFSSAHKYGRGRNISDLIRLDNRGGARHVGASLRTRTWERAPLSARVYVRRFALADSSVWSLSSLPPR